MAESILGAILEDSCYDLLLTRDIYRKHFAPFFERYCLGPHRDSQHPKSQLSQILVGKRHCRNHEMRYDRPDDETTTELKASGELSNGCICGTSLPEYSLDTRQAGRSWVCAASETGDAQSMC